MPFIEGFVGDRETRAGLEAMPGAIENPSVVRGHVKGVVPAGSRVRAVLRSLSGRSLVECEAGEAGVDASSWYHLRYERPVEEASLSRAGLVVQLIGPDGTLLAESVSLRAPQQRARIDLRPHRTARAPSEYAVLEQHIRSRLDSGPEIVDLLEDAALDDVAGWLEIEPYRVALLQRTRALASQTGLPSELFYALGRSGMSLELEDLVDVPTDELRTTVTEAVAAQIVGKDLLEGLDPMLGRLVELVIDRAIETKGGSHSGLVEALTSADIPAETIRTVLRRYPCRTGGAVEFWEDPFEPEPPQNGEHESLREDVRQSFQQAIELGGLVGSDGPLLRRLHELRREGRWQSIEDLAGLEFDEWCELIEATHPAQAAGEDVVQPEADRDEWVESKAKGIVEALEEAFPSACIRRELIATEEVSEGARRIFERAPDHDFVRHSIRERAATDGALLEGFDDAEAVLDEIESIERIARVTPRAEHVAVLVGTGMRSAHAIAATPRRHFIEIYGEALGGRGEAATVHAHAQQSAASATLALVQLLQSLQQNPRVLNGGLAAVQAPRDALKDVPDARALFGSIGSCGCEHCSSVYSPAAYFVDLLRYLDVSDPKRLKEVTDKLARKYPQRPSRSLSRYQPLEVLLLRRPDLIDIKLTCENTLTTLPYIDLVNELLEARVAGTNAAYDTGKVPADVLKAVPQNVNPEAYRQLQEAVHPTTLPFHEPLAVARAYLGHLGVSREELMKELARGDGREEATLAEELGMSREELARVVRPEQLWRHFGFPAEHAGALGWIEALAPVPAFLRATGIRFQQLIDIVRMRFINRDGAITLDANAPDCDPDKVRIVGLDETCLSRIVRLLRLQRRLKWSFTDIDRALAAFGATELDPPVLRKLVEARDLAKRLDRPIADLLGLWAPLDTSGDDSIFARLLQSRAVAWRSSDTNPFRLREGDRSELAEIGLSLDPVAPALLAAFRITNEDLALVRAMQTRRGAPPRLDLAGLSGVYRVVLLARTLRLRIEQLDAMIRLVPPDADPFTPADPAPTRRFVDIAEEVAASDFTPEKLTYLLHPVAAPRRDPGPTAAQVEAVLGSIRRGLTDAFTQTAPPAAITGDVLRAKLAIWLDTALIDQAMETLDPRTSLSPPQRRAFFDRHLARIFPDPKGAAAQLFGDGSALAAAPVLEQRWHTNMAFVLARLLPRLRVRQMRGAVVRALSDVLGTSAAGTARLLEKVLRSRRSREPLIQDFFAMLGTGLTGAYFGNAELRGEPALTRTDAKLEFSWAGAPPAEGVGARTFSVRWTGRLLPRAKALHTFFATTDGAVRIAIKDGSTESVLLDQPAAAGRAVEHVSQPIALDPSRLYEIRIEYRNSDAPGSFALQYGSGSTSKQPLPELHLFPNDGLSSFEPVADGYRRLHKAAMVVTGLGITDAHLEWLTSEPRYLDLDALPMGPSETGGAAVASFQRLRQLAALYALRKRLPRSNTDLFQVFQATTLPQAVDTLVAATGWDKTVVDAFIGPQGFAIELGQLALPVDPAAESFLLRLSRAVAIQRRVGVAPQVLFAWASSPPDSNVAQAIVQVVKARYDEKHWLEVAQLLNDPLRIERREALVAFLLPRMLPQGITNRSQFFEYFLIDVEMSPCMLTSRIKQAISAVQSFFQRCLMNLEPGVPPRLIDEGDWKWLKNYRVWEANRKIFLYPENWIEPELRDDKSPFFQELERTIVQQEIKKENVESAFIDYLQKLDEVSRLDVRAVWYEAHQPARTRSSWDEGTYHVFARTYDPPYVWFYRRLDKGRHWTPWEKIDADIEGDHLVPVVYQQRIYLFWTIFREINKPPLEPKKDAAPYKLGKDWEISIAYSVYDRGRWTRKRISSAAVVHDLKIAFPMVDAFEQAQGKKPVPRIEGSAWLPKSAYALRATVSDERDELRVYLHCRSVDLLRAQSVPEIPTSGEAFLSPDTLNLVATFGLDGCNGALDAQYIGASSYTTVLRTERQTTKLGLFQLQHTKNVKVPRLVRTAQSPFQVGSGGRIDAPSDYRIDGTGFVTTSTGRSTLSLRPGPQRGFVGVLGRVNGRGVRLLPVIDTAGPPDAGLSPFFFQDRRRSYFVRPVAASIGEKAFTMLFRARPIVGRPGVGHFGAARPNVTARKAPVGQAPAKRLRGREALDPMDRTEADDDRDDREDAGGPQDDASELAVGRRTRRNPAPSARNAPRAIRIHRAAHIDWRLRFTPFEHPATCRLIRTLKAGGIEKLLDLATAHASPEGRRYSYEDRQWRSRRPSWFAQRYQPGPLTDALHPHLDVDFEADNPYALYNWELFFHAPLQVAVRLAKDGRHEEAQRWFHFIFDPTSDSSAPAPRRYWNFAPFHENNVYDGARELMALLSYNGTDQTLLRRQDNVHKQVATWWEKPFSPHVIARQRIAAYQKAVVMKYIDNLIEWGDKLFRRDTLETIQEATQLYVLAGNILGPRPETVPPMVNAPPVSFRDVRKNLDPFSNWRVQFENKQVRPPFRIQAAPDAGGAASVLGMATLYFCIPANPQMDKYWDTVADRLFKIRNCMNIKGVVRQLALFEPPIDPGMLVRAAAAGVDLGSVIADLNAPPPHHRFRFLLARARTLAEEVRRFGEATLRVLERKDAEALAALRSTHETALLEAVRDISKTKIKQVEEEVAALALAREHVDMQIQHLALLAQTLMNPQEAARQQSLTAAQVISGVAEGVDLVSKVAYAIPDLQAGAAGGFSSPFTTVQIGGQSFGAVASAFAESLFKVMNKFTTEADMAEAQAEYQRRQEEFVHEHELLLKEKEKFTREISETNLKLEVHSAELRRHDLEVDNSRRMEAHLRDKYTSAELYGWMLGQISGIYFQAYKLAFDSAKLAERAMRFERGEAAQYVNFSYWDSLKKGLYAGESLLVDLRRMETAYLDGDGRALEITRYFSLRDDAPTALEELLATGTCKLEITEALLDGDFPGHYFRRIETVRMTVQGPLQAHSNVNCTLTLLDNRIRTDANASGSYPAAEDAHDPRFLVNFVPAHAIATSRPNVDAGVFELRFDDERYFPFEGAGAIATWRIELKQADNALDLSQLTDVVLTIAYTARSGGAPLEASARANREKGLARGGLEPPPQKRVSLKRDLPEVWKRIGEASAGQDVEVELPLGAERFSGRYRELVLRIERATVYAHPRAAAGADALRLRLDPPKSTGTPVSGWTRPWPSSQTLRAVSDVSGPPGIWKLAMGAPNAKVSDLFDDIVLVFDLRARKA